MSLRLSKRLDAIQPSITLAVTAKAAALRAKGVDVISFGAGEPDFDTPEHIKKAAHEGLDRGVAKYTTLTGLPALREAVAKTLSEVHGLSLSADQTIITVGAKQSLYLALMASLNEGEKVIVPAPYWVSYPEMVRLAGGVPVVVETSADEGFMMRPKDLDAAIDDSTRFLILNTPSNPTGGVYTRERLQEIAQICVERDIWVISDDIYRSLVYGGAEYASIASLGGDIAKRTILVDGVSKTFAMTGWRIGYTVGPVELIKAMAKIMGQSTSNASHVAQVAAIAALTGPRDCIAEMRSAFDERRKRMVELLRGIPGVDCTEPRGAFYAFPNFGSFVGKKAPDGGTLEDDVALCGYLVESAKVAVVPGSGFGAPGFVRLSYACSMEDIEKGLERIRSALSALS